jgi:hypothetical protein
MPDYLGDGNNLLKAGDYYLTKLLLSSTVNNKSIDIINLYTKIELFEDLFSPYMTGTIRMDDSFNVPEVLPLTGQEKIEIEFKTAIENTKPINKIFRVYKLDRQVTDQNGKGQQYSIHMISEGGMINYTQRCGYYVGGSVSEMVKTVVSKHFPSYVWENKFQVESSNDNYMFVLPKSYTPFKAISWLSGKAINSSANDYSPFFFYETMDGYAFKSLSSIIKDASSNIQNYYYIKENSANADGSPPSLPVDGPLSAVFHRIQNLEEISRFNMVENIMEGLVSSRLVVHDLIQKQKRESIFRESDVFTEMAKLGSDPHYKSSSKDDPIFYNDSSAYYYLPATTFSVYSDAVPIKDNVRVEDYFLKRKYMMNAMMTQKIAVDIYGDSTKRVGQIINLYTPKISSDQTVHQDKSDKNFSGNYLITSIRHTFDSAYSCKMELSRNAMGV